MPRKSFGQAYPRHSVRFFEGLNVYSGDNLLRDGELSAAQNVRCKTLGVLEKRGGFTRLGNNLSATKNFGIHHFVHSAPAAITAETVYHTDHFLRASWVGNSVNLYALDNEASTWSVIGASVGLELLQIGDTNTQWNITQSGLLTTYTWNSVGTNPGTINQRLFIGDTVNIDSDDFNAANQGEFEVAASGSSSFQTVNSSGVVESNKALTNGAIIIASAKISFATVGDVCFIVNGKDPNRYLDVSSNSFGNSNTAASSTGHLYNSPVANKVNFYKGRVYLGDYIVGANRFTTGIIRSSEPLGLMALVNGDHSANATTINVTDTKYFPSTDVNFEVDIFRGGVQISNGDLTLSGKTQVSITVDANTATCLNADEIWVSGTYNSGRRYMWPDAKEGSTDATIFDTFKLTGGDNDPLTMMTNIGDVMMISNKTTMGAWNDSNMQTLDGGIGCVSDRGFVKHSGILYFVNYRGIYVTQGGEPTLLSHNVGTYFTGATRDALEASIAHKKGQSVFFCIGDVTLYNEDGSTNKTLSDVCLEYFITAKQWFVHTNVDADDMTTYIGSSDPDRLIFSSAAGSGNLYEFLSGTSDDGADIPIDVTTGSIVVSSNFEDISYPKHIITELLAGTGLKAFISLDGEPFYEAGEGNKGATIIRLQGRNQEMPPPRGRNLKVSFRESSNRVLKFSAFAVEYAPVAEKEIQRG